MDFMTTSPMSQKSSIPDTAGQSPSVAAASQGSQMLPAHPGPSASASHGFAQKWGDGPTNWLQFEPGNEFPFDPGKWWFLHWRTTGLLTTAHRQMIPLRNKKNPRPWTHQIHIGCLGAAATDFSHQICHQICGELLMSKALHPAGSGGYPPIQASPRNPQLDTPDRPDACLKMSIQDETIVKLRLLEGWHELWYTLNSIPWHEFSLEMHAFRPGVDCMWRTSPSAGSQLHT